MKYLLFVCVVVLCLGNVSLLKRTAWLQNLLKTQLLQVLCLFFGPIAQARSTAIQAIATARATAIQAIATARATAIRNTAAARQAFITNLFPGLGK